MVEATGSALVRTETLEPTILELPVVKVLAGANETALTIPDGRTYTVGLVRSKMAEILNLSPDHDALVNGASATEQTELRHGDQVEFIRRAGVKG